MSGVAMKVDVIAMMTSIANMLRGMTPRSYPMLIATSSMSARVFMHTPMASAERLLSPTSRAPA